VPSGNLPQVSDDPPDMSTVEFTPPSTRAERARHHTRRAMPELRKLVKFGVVGGSGYVVNLIAFAIVDHFVGRHFIAATVAYLAAVGNNFHWNRRWTFDAVGTEAVHRQAHRFFVVSTVSFLCSLAILELLVNVSVAPLVAQAISIAALMPFAFVANRVWTFAEPGTLRQMADARRGRRTADRDQPADGSR